MDTTDSKQSLLHSGPTQEELERVGNRYSNTLVRCAKSPANAVFCQQVFGANLSQANMMDMMQLEKLLEVLNLSSENKVLDLACGIGSIAEYISDTTGAYVLGIDIAKEAIKYAQKRTWQKRTRLEFQYGDLNNLRLPPASFDTVIAIACLHFAENLGETIRQLKEVLTTDSQMGMFTFQYRSEIEPPETLWPDNTDLGQALKKYSLNFIAWEFTEREIKIRRKQLRAAEELINAYREEGNLDLIEDRIEECEIDLPYLEAGLKRRYLYHITTAEPITATVA
jgi:ubiquinone/menaquinone biosynthesis C-methylase UbiE